MPRRVGPAEELTEAQLDALAAIGPSDVQAAALTWREDAPDAYRRLLDATAESVGRGTPPEDDA